LLELNIVDFVGAKYSGSYHKRENFNRYINLKKWGSLIGMNFYKIDGTHIGKRSAGGKYCWNCGITLCEQGIFKIHDSKSKWFDCCPNCGIKPIEDDNRSVMIELGFEKHRIEKSRGITSISTFTWGISNKEYENLFIHHSLFESVIKDENGRIFNLTEFDNMLKFNCPIHYYDLVGKEFS